MLNRRKMGMTSSPHGPYGRGYTRTTMATTEGSNIARWSQSQSRPVQIGVCNRLHEVGIAVIAHQNGAVNTFPGLVHTARHTTKVGGPGR